MFHVFALFTRMSIERYINKFFVYFAIVSIHNTIEISNFSNRVYRLVYCFTINHKLRSPDRSPSWLKTNYFFNEN